MTTVDIANVERQDKLIIECIATNSNTISLCYVDQKSWVLLPSAGLHRGMADRADNVATWTTAHCQSISTMTTFDVANVERQDKLIREWIATNSNTISLCYVYQKLRVPLASGTTAPVNGGHSRRCRQSCQRGLHYISKVLVQWRSLSLLMLNDKIN